MIDPAFPLASELMRMVTTFDGECRDVERGVRSHVYEIALDMPVELSLARDAEGQLQIGISPPLYYTDTTFRPSYHRVRLTALREDSFDDRPTIAGGPDGG